MKVTVVGTGYVGLVSGTCLAEVGNNVLCLDVDPKKIRILQEGGIPIFEPGLLDMVKRNVAAGRLRFTTDVAEAVAHGTIQFIAVGTPPDEDGSADLQAMIRANLVAERVAIVEADCRPQFRPVVVVRLEARDPHDLSRGAHADHHRVV